MFLTSVRSLFILLILLAAAGSFACSYRTPETARVEAAVEVPEMSADPEVNAALDFIRKTPDSTAGYNQLAVLYIKQARKTGDFSIYGAAETAVGKALKVDPKDFTARRLQSSLHLTYHRFSEALALGNDLNAETPNDAFVFGVLTDANVEIGNYDEAVRSAQKMVDLKPNTASYARVAHIRSLYGDHSGAVEMFKLAARTADPADAEARAWCLVQLGDEFWKNGKYGDAEKVYDEALTVFPDFYLALAGKGRVRAAQNDLESAITFLTDSLNRVPNVETAILLGDIYTKQGNVEKAKQQYGLVEVIEQKTGVNNDQKRLALLWADQNIRLDDALAITTREYEGRKDIFTADALAWCLYKKGRLDEAKKAITAAMVPKANDARILYHAGMIAKASGSMAEAKRLISNAIKLNPAFDLLQADEAKRELEELK